MSDKSPPLPPVKTINRPRLLPLVSPREKRRASEAQLKASLQKIKAEERLIGPLEPPKGWLQALSLTKIDERLSASKRAELEDQRLEAWRYLLCFTYSKLYRRRAHLRHRLKRGFHLEELTTDLSAELWAYIRDHPGFVEREILERETLKPTKSTLAALERELNRLIIDLTFTSRLHHYMWRVLTEELRELSREPHPIYGQLYVTTTEVWLERPVAEESDESLMTPLPSLRCDLNRGHQASDERGEGLAGGRLGDLIARGELKAWLWEVLPTQSRWHIQALLQHLKASLSPSPFEVYFCWDQKLSSPDLRDSQRGESAEGAKSQSEAPPSLIELSEDRAHLSPAEELMRERTWPQLRTELVMRVIEGLDERSLLISAASVGLQISSGPKLSDQLQHFGYTYSTFLVQGALRSLREAQQEAQRELTEALGEDEALSAELLSTLNEQLQAHWEELCDD